MLASLASAQEAPDEPVFGTPAPDLHGLSAEFVTTADEALVSTTLPLEADHFEVLLRVVGDGVDVSWAQGPYAPNEAPLVEFPEGALPSAGQHRQVIGRVLAFDGDSHEISRVHLESFEATSELGAVAFAPEPTPVEFVDDAGRTVIELNPAGGE